MKFIGLYVRVLEPPGEMGMLVWPAIVGLALASAMFVEPSRSTHRRHVANAQGHRRTCP